MKNKILAIVCLSVMAVLIIASFVSALVKVNGNNVIVRPDEVYITSMSTNNDNFDRHAYHLRNITSNQSKIDNIYSSFNRGFEQSFLKSLFTGELHDKMTTNYSHQVGEEVSDSIDKSYSTSNQYTVIFYYNDAKTIKADGKTLEYQYLFFTVNNSDKRVLVTFATNTSEKVDVSPDNMEAIKDALEYEFSYKAKANFKDLYNYIDSLDFYV